MILAWATTAWDDYLYWQATDKKVLKRINTLIEDIKRRWQAENWWDEPNGKSAKQAKAIYVGQ